MAKIILFGANGNIGRLFLKLTASTSHQITGVIQNPDQREHLTTLNTNASFETLSLALATSKDIQDLMTSHDAVVFTVGSRGKNLLQVDLDATVKAFEAATAANIKRFILISAVYAESRAFWKDSPILNYYIAKHYADRILEDEFPNLDYTILKPTLLTDGEGTGKVRILPPARGDGSDQPGSIDRIDVARVMLSILNEPSTFKASYNFANGDVPIDKAFN
ncbi:uncharacterized protein KQ657_001229 [Scheffersomyces spartinae]|uniref:NAD(P)-binding domain-containing protein n=1 Tax=Scheffersomyces spartinae TaxID=45513 RepID=A0A9P7V896_9ASCO|nr:uncharacterized protein KQ657_001229 [Scheffersomyces spartinae]KAG7193112.1 hypothetical protein KQ657_001229 [Scheffersomyces spartinae]